MMLSVMTLPHSAPGDFRRSTAGIAGRRAAELIMRVPEGIVERRRRTLLRYVVFRGLRAT